jgi:hypothetical protein
VAVTAALAPVAVAALGLAVALLALVPFVLLAAGAPALVGFLLFDCFARSCELLVLAVCLSGWC